MNSVSCAVQVKMKIDNETDYDKGDETMNLDTWMLHLALNYFVFTVNQHNVIIQLALQCWFILVSFMKHNYSWLKFGFTIFLSYDILQGHCHQVTEKLPRTENYSHPFDNK